jgi:serine/threonine-protein kinase HipA
MMKIELLTVKYHDRMVGMLSLTPDNKLCAFEYAHSWLAEGFSISPLELPLRLGLFLAKPSPFFGNFGIFEDSLPDGYGRYLLHKLLQKEGLDDFKLSALDRLSIVGSGGMGALTFEPETSIKQGTNVTDFDLLQDKALGTNHPEAPFKEEYVIPQILMQCLLIHNKTNTKTSYVGIRYLSNKAYVQRPLFPLNEKKKLRRYFNYAFPAFSP